MMPLDDLTVFRLGFSAFVVPDPVVVLVNPQLLVRHIDVVQTNRSRHWSGLQSVPLWQGQTELPDEPPQLQM
ncbi:MAG UNVERIFIED_CONTAM: hypothetical protein LVR18_49280 [Planctomycetaceae bacterium]|jgi:hypothetical protein